MAQKVFNLVTSLKLTVVLLSLGAVLVFIGTLAQVDVGLYVAQQQYFQSMFLYWSPAGSDWRIPWFPGGYLIGTLLLINLIAAHIKRFEFSRKKAGIFIIHAGIILLLLGQLVTEQMQVESAMRLVEGESMNYSENQRKTEVVIVDATEPEFENVLAVPEYYVAKKKPIDHEQLPFRVEVKRYIVNSRLANRPADATAAPPATQGLGPRIIATQVPPTAKMDERNVPATVLEVIAPEGSLGTWLVSPHLDMRQSFEYRGRTYELEMRFTRYYKPFDIHLIKFTHDKYKGTEIARNFASRIEIHNHQTGEQRETLIYMNNPLRYWGETYYQGSYDKHDPRISILQVVRNPAWLTPYVACTLVGVGMLVQFLSHLFGFAMKRRSA
jgi:hypothetical protein